MIRRSLYLYHRILIKLPLLVKLRINGLYYNINVPESEVNLALNGAVTFYEFVILKETVVVTSKFD